MTRYFGNTGHHLLDTELHFSSGANSPKEIDALVMTGNNPGVAVNHLSEAGMQAIEAWAGAYWNRFFVDSGAFSEVTFGDHGPELSAPISDVEWERRLAKYDRLARTMGRQVYLVAPDCVAHQELTLARLAKYAVRIAQWIAAGANVIVPVQKGQLPMDVFASQVCQILGCLSDDVIWGIPMKKDATNIAELEAFAESMQPARVHLLGCGPRNSVYRKAIIAVRDACEMTDVYSDAVRITALVGKTSGRGGGPRAITRYLAGGCNKLEATARAMMDDYRQALAQAQTDGWRDPELDGPGQLSLF